MAVNYKIRYSGHALPTEHTIVDDTETAKAIHDTIGKGIGGDTELESGTITANITAYQYDPTASYVSLSTIIGSTVTGIDFLYFEIIDRDKSYPSVYMKLGTLEAVRLTDRQDFSLLRLNNYSSDDIYFKSRVAKETIEILVGKEA